MTRSAIASFRARATVLVFVKLMAFNAWGAFGVFGSGPRTPPRPDLTSDLQNSFGDMQYLRTCTEGWQWKEVMITNPDGARMKEAQSVCRKESGRYVGPNSYRESPLTNKWIFWINHKAQIVELYESSPEFDHVIRQDYINNGHD